MSEAAWKDAFDKFDADGSGVISSRELVNCLEGLLGDHDKAVSVGAVSNCIFFNVFNSSQTKLKEVKLCMSNV